MTLCVPDYLHEDLVECERPTPNVNRGRWVWEYIAIGVDRCHSGWRDRAFEGRCATGAGWKLCGSRNTAHQVQPWGAAAVGVCRFIPAIAADQFDRCRPDAGWNRDELAMRGELARWIAVGPGVRCCGSRRQGFDGAAGGTSALLALEPFPSH